MEDRMSECLECNPEYNEGAEAFFSNKGEFLKIESSGIYSTGNTMYTYTTFSFMALDQSISTLGNAK